MISENAKPYVSDDCPICGMPEEAFAYGLYVCRGCKRKTSMVPQELQAENSRNIEELQRIAEVAERMRSQGKVKDKEGK